MAFESLFQKYDRLVLFDTETTGLQFSRDEIIEFAAVVVELVNGVPTITREYDELVALSPGGFVPPKITELTGISTQDLREKGLPKTRVCRDIAELIAGNTLLLAYNAHFDLSFLFYMLLRHGDPAILKGKDKLDLLTYTRIAVHTLISSAAPLKPTASPERWSTPTGQWMTSLPPLPLWRKWRRKRTTLCVMLTFLVTTPNTASTAKPSVP